MMHKVEVNSRVRAKKRAWKSDGNTKTNEKNENVAQPRMAPKDGKSTFEKHKTYATHPKFFPSRLSFLFVCSPEGVRAHAKGARAGHESSADLAS